MEDTAERIKLPLVIRDAYAGNCTQCSPSSLENLQRGEIVRILQKSDHSDRYGFYIKKIDGTIFGKVCEYIEIEMLHENTLNQDETSVRSLSIPLKSIIEIREFNSYRRADCKIIRERFNEKIKILSEIKKIDDQMKTLREKVFEINKTITKHLKEMAVT